VFKTLLPVCDSTSNTHNTQDADMNEFNVDSNADGTEDITSALTYTIAKSNITGCISMRGVNKSTDRCE